MFQFLSALVAVSTFVFLIHLLQNLAFHQYLVLIVNFNFHSYCKKLLFCCFIFYLRKLNHHSFLSKESLNCSLLGLIAFGSPENLYLHSEDQFLELVYHINYLLHFISDFGFSILQFEHISVQVLVLFFYLKFCGILSSYPKLKTLFVDFSNQQYLFHYKNYFF